VGECGLDSLRSGLGLVVGSSEDGNESIKDGEFLTSQVTVSFSRRILLHGWLVS
jgi:hypothetical protein